MMKYGAIVTVLLCSLMMLMTGCEPTGPAGGNAQPGAKKRIGVSIPAATHGWPAGVGWWADQAMKDYPDIQWVYQRAATPTEQDQQLQAMIEQNLDALVVLPFDSSTALNTLKNAKKRGVFLVSVDRGLDEPIADIYLAGDNKSFGRKSGEYMAEKLGGKGNILVLRGMQVQIDQERFDGFNEVIAQHPDIKVLGVEHGQWNRETAQKKMQDMLTKFSDQKIDAIWASDDDMALGVEQALREAGRAQEVWVLGGAGMKDIVKRVMDNDRLFPADITYPPGMIAAGIHLAAGKITGAKPQDVAEKVPAHLGLNKQQAIESLEKTQGQRPVKLDVQLITPENAKEYYFPDSVY